MIEGRSARAIITNAIGDLVRLPLFLTGYLRRREPRSWVFGNIHGFKDSPRYLAEYVLHSRPDLEATWIAGDSAEADAVRSAGIRVALRGQADARRIQRRAGVAVFAHGFLDLEIEHLAGARIVFVWHGTPLKKIALDVGVGARRVSLAGTSSFAVRLVHRLGFRLVGMFVASGELEQRRFMTAFGVSAAHVPQLGSPRFDVIRGGPAYDLIVRGDLRAQLGFKPEDQIVLWLPTHRREYGDEQWLPTLAAEDLERALDGTEVKLVVKPHPRANFDVFRERLPMANPRVRLLPAEDIDINCLLHIADGLITDYSSVVCDYAILDRPIYFLAPDVASYSDKRGLYDPYGILTAGRHHADWASLLSAIRADLDHPGQGEGHALVVRMNDYLGLNRQPGSIGRVVDAIDRLTTESVRIAAPR